MPIHTIPEHRHIPRLDEPATVTGLTIIVGIQCKRCETPTAIGLMNAQPAVCDGCGTVFTLDAVVWQKGNPVPQIRLSATPSRGQTLMS